MGCCVSTSTNSPPPSKSPHHIPNFNFTNSKSPHQSYPIPEEETVVEEVPYENHRPCTKPAPFLPEFDKHTQNDASLENPNSPLVALSKDELPEVLSDICSTINESVNVSTMVEKKDTKNADESRQRSPAGFTSRTVTGEVKKELKPGRPQIRTSDPTPGRVRPGNPNGNTRRENGGESSTRRSRSPFLRTDSGISKPSLGRSQSPGTRGKSPGRVGSELGERAHVNEWEERAGKVIETNDHRQLESLENPLMSLECFIFL